MHAGKQTSKPAGDERVDLPGEGASGEETCNMAGTTSGRTSVVEQVFGIKMLQRMQSLQGSKPAVDKATRCFQVDLQYPRKRAKTAPPSPNPKSSPQKGAPASVLAQTDARPSFSEVLLTSLRAESETRAWFNDQLKYQYVRQTRTPLGWPQVLALGTGLQDRSNLDWWQPVLESKPKLEGPSEHPWAPWALALELKDGEVIATEADNAAKLQTPSDDTSQRAVYELTALLALIQEDGEALAASQGSSAQDEGHLIAHVRVPASYLDKEVGLMPTPRAQPPSPGFTPTTFFRTQKTFDPVPSLPEDPFEGLPEDPFGDSSAEEAQEKEGAAAEHGLPEDPFGSDPALSDGEGAARLGQHPDNLDLPDASLPKGSAVETSPAQEEVDMQHSQLSAEGSSAAVTEALRPGNDNNPATDQEAQHAVPEPAEIPAQFTNLKVSAERVDSLSHSGSVRRASMQEPTWLLINDFSIAPTPRAEVLQLYGGHKLPCMLYYTQVSAMQAATRQDFQVEPAPVLSDAAFHRLCRAPPLQAALVGLSRVATPTFWPLTAEEGPREGLILGLDAEFVAFSPPTTAFRAGAEIETAPSRLGLARVSVVRGEGSQAGRACIDDYIRATEPVYDYLTQYSGLQPGDLDPAMSPHHLTTMKAAYLKLRHLVDCGCVLVGHGLKKDFRMINVVVSPAQVIDTVDLFYLKKQRKLSLRFLAAYLLRRDIQQVTHDSIEDARTALSLYEMYQKLEGEGRLREVLQSMYAWGKQHGWDPNALKENPASNLPSPVKPYPRG